MTLKEIAKMLGLAPSTVSRALNHPEMVSIETRRRVERAVRQYRYRPNTIARSLRVQDSQTIGLVLSDITNPFHAELARAVETAARQRGYTVILSNSDEDEDLERLALETLLSWQVRGLILAPCGRNRSLVEESLRLGIPVVQVDRVIDGLQTDAVLVDNRAGSRMAVEHLVALGHRRIAHIAGPQRLTTGAERLEGFRQAMADAGIPEEEQLVAYGDFREEGGYRATLELFRERHSPDEWPTAIFAANNEMAAGAIRALGELGHTIPDRISFVTFDDSRWAQLMHPALTVVAQPVEEIGRAACELLLRRIESGRSGATLYTLQPTLIRRQSTAPRQLPPSAAPRTGRRAGPARRGSVNGATVKARSAR